MHYTKKNAKEPNKFCQGAKFGSGATVWTTLLYTVQRCTPTISKIVVLVCVIKCALIYSASARSPIWTSLSRAYLDEPVWTSLALAYLNEPVWTSLALAYQDEPRAYSTNKHEANTSFSHPWRLSLDKHELFIRAHRRSGGGGTCPSPIFTGYMMIWKVYLKRISK